MGCGIPRSLNRVQNLLLMFAPERLKRNCQLHRRIPVRTDKLVMVKADHIPLILSNDLRHTHQFARLVRQHDGECEDPVPLDQAMLDDG